MKDLMKNKGAMLSLAGLAISGLGRLIEMEQTKMMISEEVTRQLVAILKGVKK